MKAKKIGSDAVQAKVTPSFNRHQLLLTQIWELLTLVDSIAKLEFPSHSSLPELQRSLVSLIGNFRSATSTELAILTGREKAQISHAVSELAKHGLIERKGYVAPLTLSPAGRALFESLVDTAERGDIDLCRGLPRTTVADFLNVLQRLLDQAGRLLLREQEISLGNCLDDAPLSLEFSTFPKRLRTIGPHRPMSLMVAPRLQALGAYLERGAAQTYRRQMDLALFDLVVISHLGDQDQLLLSELINRTVRDKGQVGRTVKHLETIGLVTRPINSTTRRVALCLTSAGWKVASQAFGMAKIRDRELFDDMSKSERVLFVETLAKLQTNAAAILRDLVSAKSALNLPCHTDAPQLQRNSRK
jgi:DNA-binding MarR family transcriptional regulator